MSVKVFSIVTKKDTTPTKLNSESLSIHVLLNQYVLDFSL